ncbi:MAG: TAXI family TRAP transporter solute-binding subunit [Gammaproteobacteria bacterium]|nr:TAXI family TRAP transporter solute-binding subunit [Gammaproteobacteria bacterium]
MTGCHRRSLLARACHALHIAVSLVTVCLLAACSQGDYPDELRIGTASLGGAYYPVGQGIATVFTEHAEGYGMFPVVTAGSLENPRLLQSGDIELGISNIDLAYFAANGLPPYRSAMPVAALGALYASVLHIVVRADSPIKSIADLRGRKLAVGAVGGGTQLLVVKLLAAYGIGENEVTMNYLSFADGFSQLGDGNLDAAFALSAYPASAIMEVKSKRDIRFVGLAADEPGLAGFLQREPYYRVTDLPAKSYDLPAPVAVLAVDNVLLVRADAEDDMVYRMTNAIYGHLDELGRHHAALRNVDAAHSLDLPVALHPAAGRAHLQLVGTATP